MPFTEKEIVIKGNRVSYFDEGLREGTTILFIHGFPLSKEMWNSQLSAFSETHRVIAYDVRGYGHSELGTLAFSVTQFATDLHLFMNALGLDKAVVCGLSMGGYIALNAIEQNPERIMALILCDTQCNADTPETREKRIKTIAMIRLSGLRKYADELIINLFSPASLATLSNEVTFIKNSILSTSPDTVCKTLHALATRSDACSDLARTKIPVLIMVGKEDKITPIAAALAMHELIQVSVFEIIEGAGHLSNIENAPVFNTCLMNFLDKLQENAELITSS